MPNQSHHRTTRRHNSHLEVGGAEPAKRCA